MVHSLLVNLKNLPKQAIQFFGQEFNDLLRILAILSPQHVVDITFTSLVGHYMWCQLLLRMPGLLTVAATVVSLGLLELRNYQKQFYVFIALCFCLLFRELRKLWREPEKWTKTISRQVRLCFSNYTLVRFSAVVGFEVTRRAFNLWVTLFSRVAMREAFQTRMVTRLLTS